MRYPPQLLDEIRARLPVSHVVGRRVALKKKGREYAGLSPFKSEKTPSFFVNDQKGFYHCFASGEHGDIFKFLMAMEGLTFPEAVERLAAEAGVALPKHETRDEEQYERRQRLYTVLEEAAKFFQQRLHGSGGQEARAYLEKRGLKRDMISGFRIGYAPNSRTALEEYLGAAGFNMDEMTQSGMLISGSDIPRPYDRFRHRVMFPIADMKGRIIAFGGRALDPAQPAKYLNSPETPLFHKGQTLFNMHRARSAAHDRGRVIVVEGYMDVAALDEAGFGEAVAPLGTALTEDQAQLLWRMAPEPVLCFDGDGAGRRAAWRAIDTVLPLLKPGVSVSFAFLPDGFDPDDLIRQQGSEAMETVLKQARPLAEVLFEREWASGDWSTPERRALLEQQLKALVTRISDPGVRGHYERDVRQRLWAAWRPQGGGRSGAAATLPTGAGYARQAAGENRPTYSGSRGGRPNAYRGPAGANQTAALSGSRPAPTSSLLRSGLVAGGKAALPEREVLLLRTLLNHPWLAEEEAEAIATLEFSSPALSRIRDAILSFVTQDNSLDSAGLRTHLNNSDLGKLVGLVDRSVTHKCDRFAEPDAGRTEVQIGWRHALALHDRHAGLGRALEAAERAWHEDRSEDAFHRIRELQAELQRVTREDAFDGDQDQDTGGNPTARGSGL